MSGQNHDWLEPELRATGAAVAALRRPIMPAGLLERTLERMSQLKPARKTLLLLRPITHPLARIAAVVMLMSMSVPLTDLDTADSMGRRIEYSVVGTRTVDRIEQVMDRLLADGYTQNDLDTLIPVYPSNAKIAKRKLAKPHAQPKV